MHIVGTETSYIKYYDVQLINLHIILSSMCAA